MALLLMLSVIVSCTSPDKGADGADKNDDKDKNNENSDNSDNTDDEKMEDENKIDYKTTMDIYFVVGQSNAAGNTAIRDIPGIKSLDSALSTGTGFSNVHFSGNSWATPNTRMSWRKTTYGLGINSNCIGPELGIAHSLSKYYNADTGRHAGIIKFAQGNTHLLNQTYAGANDYGNWVSPSYAAAIGANYSDTAITGGLYRKFLDQIKESINTLEAYSGHTKINLVGLYWMQGENDRVNPIEYQRAIQYFVSDLRKDISDIMLEFTNGESDCGAADLPMLIGTISRTCGITNADTELMVNTPFVLMQKKLPETIENCYIVDNSNYKIGSWNPNTNKVNVVGNDVWHWNQRDMVAIGQNVGNMFLDEIVKKK